MIIRASTKTHGARLCAQDQPQQWWEQSEGRRNAGCMAISTLLWLIPRLRDTAALLCVLSPLKIKGSAHGPILKLNT